MIETTTTHSNDINNVNREQNKNADIYPGSRLEALKSSTINQFLMVSPSKNKNVVYNNKNNKNSKSGERSKKEMRKSMTEEQCSSTETAIATTTTTRARARARRREMRSLPSF